MPLLLEPSAAASNIMTDKSTLRQRLRNSAVSKKEVICQAEEAVFSRKFKNVLEGQVLLCKGKSKSKNLRDGDSDSEDEDKMFAVHATNPLLMPQE